MSPRQTAPTSTQRSQSRLSFRRCIRDDNRGDGKHQGQKRHRDELRHEAQHEEQAGRERMSGARLPCAWMRSKPENETPPPQ